MVLKADTPSEKPGGEHSSRSESPIAPDRQMQAMIASGALGGGMLLAGFGLVPALLGAATGGGLAYWLEHRAAKKSQQRAA
jgi:hypothetical protein